MSDKQLSLVSRISLAALELRGWQPDKHNKEQNYGYISADAVLHRAGEALARQGVVIVPSIIDHGYDIFTTPNGKNRYDAWVSFDMTMTCEGGEVLSCRWFGRGSDYTVVDKAAYKAITSGHKYFLMKLLNIGVGNEDSEHDEPDEKPSKKAQQSSQKAQQKQSALSDLATGDTLKNLHVVGSSLYGNGWDKKRAEIVTAKTKGRTASSKELTEDEALALVKGIAHKLEEQAAQPAPEATPTAVQDDAPPEEQEQEQDDNHPLANEVHKLALATKASPNVGDVIAALKSDDRANPEFSRETIKEEWEPITGKAITPATKITVETALKMYEHVVGSMF